MLIGCILYPVNHSRQIHGTFNRLLTNNLNILIHRLRHEPINRPQEAPPDLLTEIGKGIAQRGTGNLDQPPIWLIQLLDQKQRASGRQRTDEQDDNDRRIAGRGQAEAEEDNHEPEYQYHEEWR